MAKEPKKIVLEFKPNILTWYTRTHGNAYPDHHIAGVLNYHSSTFKTKEPIFKITTSDSVGAPFKLVGLGTENYCGSIPQAQERAFTLISQFLNTFFQGEITLVGQKKAFGKPERTGM